MCKRRRCKWTGATSPFRKLHDVTALPHLCWKILNSQRNIILCHQHCNKYVPSIINLVPGRHWPHFACHSASPFIVDTTEVLMERQPLKEPRRLLGCLPETEGTRRTEIYICKVPLAYLTQGQHFILLSSSPSHCNQAFQKQFCSCLDITIAF